MVTARTAARMLVEEAKRGKVAVLFGNERTGLTNEELAQAHACRQICVHVCTLVARAP